MERIILLNANFTYLSTITWKQAIKLMVKGKVEVLKETKKIIRSTGNVIDHIVIPKILRLVKLIRTVFKNKVPFSKRNVFVRDNFRCQYCGTFEGKMTVDHVIPTSRNGRSTFDNCVTSCKKCNNKKDNRTPAEARMFLHKQPYTPTIMEFIIIKMKNMGIDKVLDDLWKHE